MIRIDLGPFGLMSSACDCLRGGRAAICFILLIFCSKLVFFQAIGCLIFSNLCFENGFEGHYSVGLIETVLFAVIVPYS